MTNGRKEMYIIIGLLAVAVVGLSVGYAALSSTLETTVGKVTQSNLEWSIAFEGSTASAEEEGTSSTGRSCGVATISGTQVTVADTKVSKPGDKCTYTLKVVNSGGIDASLTTITPVKPTGSDVTCDTADGGNMVCGNVTYKLTSDASGDTVLENDTTVTAGSGQTMYLVVSYTGAGLNESEVVQTGAGFTLVYNQK